MECIVCWAAKSQAWLSDFHFQFQYQFTSVQSLSRVRLFATPWIAARQASLSITNSQSSLRFTSIESVILSSHLILCHPLLLLPPILPRIRVFSNESTLHMRWPKYWSFSLSIIPSFRNHKSLYCNCKENSDSYSPYWPWVTTFLIPPLLIYIRNNLYRCFKKYWVYFMRAYDLPY